MKLLRLAALGLVLTSAPAHPAFAQLPGQPKGPGSYNPVGDMRYTFERWEPSETVRQVQQALRDKGYYNGPLDGVLNPELRTAIWNFQQATGLPRSAQLDGPTMAALDVPATGAASPAPPRSFGATSAPSHLNDVEAP